jgi:hypothetical protein
MPHLFRTPVTGTFAVSYDQWSPYSFPTSLLLSLVLLIVGIGLVLLGKRLKNKVNVPHPGGVLKVAIIVIWVLSLFIFLQIYRTRVELFHGAVQTGPIFPITMASAVCTFVYLAYVSRPDGLMAALGNGLAGAAAGPMVFEFPFDCIVIPQAQVPTTYIIVFFAPLLFAVLTTFSLLLLCKRVSITRYSVYSLAAMLIVFAAWASAGFSYPSTRVPFTLNAIS